MQLLLHGDVAKFVRHDGNIETDTKITVSPNDSVEIRRLEIKNLGNIDETLEISCVLEPIISSKEQDYAHPAFNNLFLMYEYLPELNIILVKRKKRSENDKEIFMAVTLFGNEPRNGGISTDFEFEISKERLIERNNFGVPKLIENSRPFSKKIELITDSIIAMRKTIDVKAKENIKLDFVICVSDDKDYVLKTIKKYMDLENNKRIFELSRAKIEAENRYLNLKENELNVYQKLLTFILGSNINVYKDSQNMENKIYSINELWKFGISGDLPIIFVKIKNINDIDIIEDLVKAYEYYRTKNIKFDLVILNEEKGNYDTYVNEGIHNIISNKGLEYMLNTKGGIYVLSNIKKEDKKIISLYSKIVLDAQNGNLNLQLNDIEEGITKIYTEKNNEKIELLNEPKVENQLNSNNLLYYNEYGGFSQDGKEYCLRINKENNTPTIWSNIMANDKFGTLVTESYGGYSWYKNCRLNRVSAWSNNQILDIPSEAIYLKDEESQKVWSIGYNPMPDNNDYYVTYGFGYSKFKHSSCGIEQELEVFVPKEDSAKIQILRLKNSTPRRRRIKLIYYVKPVLGEDEIKTNEFINIEFNKNSNTIFANNMVNTDYKDIIFVSSSEKIKSYTGNRDEFFGDGNISNPYGLELDNFSNKTLGKRPNIIVIQLDIELESLEDKEISIILGAGENKIECQDLSYKYSNLNNCNHENELIRKYWSDLLNNVQVETPVESMNIMLNGWIMYQTITSRLLARTGFYQSGGAFRL